MHELRLSLAYAAQADFAKAHALARASVRDDPKLVDARVQLGQLLMSSGAPARALAEFEAAQQLEPRSEVILLMRARAVMELGEFRSAIASLQEAAGINPYHRQVLRDLAWTYSHLGEYPAAIRTFQQYFAAGYSDAESQRKLVQLMRASG